MYRHNRDEGHLAQNFDSLATEQNGLQIYAEWRRYWDLSKHVLLEKSPIHVYMTHVLQYWFTPQRSSFVVVMRHPFASYDFIHKVNKRNRGHWLKCGGILIESWLDAHETLFRGLNTLQKHVVMHLERFLLGDTNGLE